MCKLSGRLLWSRSDSDAPKEQNKKSQHRFNAWVWLDRTIAGRSWWAHVGALFGRGGGQGGLIGMQGEEIFIVHRKVS